MFEDECMPYLRFFFVGSMESLTSLFCITVKMMQEIALNYREIKPVFSQTFLEISDL